jgi:hypothetical protein
MAPAGGWVRSIRRPIRLHSENRLSTTAATTDFDIVVRFVAQYVTDRLSDAIILETAS